MTTEPITRRRTAQGPFPDARDEPPAEALPWKQIALLPLVALLEAACLPKALDGRSDRPVGPNEPGYDRAVQVRFLGVGGFTIRRGGHVVMTAPLYSNPSADHVLSRSILPNEGLIRVELDRIAPDLPDVRAILVGHSHYDHLMDVPVVWQRTRDRNPEGATIYAGATAKRILSGYANGNVAAPHPPPSRIQTLNDAVDTTLCSKPSDCIGPDGEPDPPPGRPGRWITVPHTGGRVRLMALCSRHPPQLMGEHLWPGCVGEERRSPPARAADYPEGEVFAYLVDFVDAAGRPEFRVYYQDAPTSDPTGYAPASLIAEKTVDLALLCGGSFNAVTRPEDIVDNLRAHRVIIHHWESFFRPTHERLGVIPGLPIEDFHRALLLKLGGEKRRLHLLRPDVLKVIRDS